MYLTFQVWRSFKKKHLWVWNQMPCNILCWLCYSSRDSYGKTIFFFIVLKPLFFLFPESLVMLNDVLNQIESQNVSPNPISHSAPTSSSDINPVSKMHMLIIVLEDIPLAWNHEKLVTDVNQKMQCIVLKVQFQKDRETKISFCHS